MKSNVLNSKSRTGLPEGGFSTSELDYWTPRLLRSTFTAEARPGSEEELFARFEHEGHWSYFPLESGRPTEAAQRAAEISRLLDSRGWKAVCSQYTRQIVWAIFWSREPLTCTYSTLFTFPGRKSASANGTPARSRLVSSVASKIAVALVEQDGAVRRGLEQGINEIAGYVCAQSVASGKDLLESGGSNGPAAPRLIFFNERSLDLATEAFQKGIQARWPGALTVGFGIYGHSDELFITIHGMDKGYFLRRRAPKQILEPLEGFWQEGNKHAPLTPSEGERGSAAAKLQAHVQAYFQKLILSGKSEGGSNGSGALTQRETEILRYLGAGQTDKTISTILGISAWTVHAHVKSIFEKLGVHTRAEAIMRYMQK